MAAEPNRKMEDLLKVYAEHRRQQSGGGWPLPDSTRRSLQAEVARTYGTGRGQAIPPLFAMAHLWRRLILGGAGVALLVIGAGVWLRWDQAREQNMALVQETNLFFFGGTATQNGAPAATPDALQERLRRFELGVAERGGTEPPPPAAAPIQAVPQEQETVAETAPARPPAQDEQIQLALTLPTAPPEAAADLVSNAPRFQFGLPQRRTVEAAAAPAAQPGAAPAAPALVDSVPAKPAALPVQLTAAAPQPAASQLDEALSAPDSSPRPAPTAAQPLRGPSPQPAVRGVAEGMRPSPADAGVEQASRPLARTAGRAALAETQDSRPAPRTLHFQQVDHTTRYRRNLNSPPVPRVLTQFEVRQLGSNVRIVDADGSIYEGPAQAAVELGRSSAPQRSTVSAVSAQGTALQTGAMAPTADQPFSFRVIGTNRTLNQPVIFTGGYVPGATGSGTGGAERGRGVAQGQISGQAAVGGKSQIRIEAQQVER